jgi:hypothetical protein
MEDPRLNSLHLDSGRREHYRHARDVLLASRGSDTCFAERRHQEDSSVDNTFIRNRPGSLPTSHEFWLLDREYIYPLKVGLNTMGRSGDNDVVVEDLFVSRRHAAILVHHDHSFILHDTASKNGTYLNGSRISGPTPLTAGDEIRICNRQFVFFTRNSPAAACPVSPTRTVAE